MIFKCLDESQLFFFSYVQNNLGCCWQCIVCWFQQLKYKAEVLCHNDDSLSCKAGEQNDTSN